MEVNLMVRTQVLLTEHQHAVLKELSSQSGLSLSELVRRAIEKMLAEQKRSKTESALGLLGAFSGGPTDVAENHDHYLWGIEAE